MENDAATAAARTARVLHAVFLLSIPMYAGAGEMIPHTDFAPERLELLRRGFYVVAVAMFGVATVFKSRMVAAAEERLRLNVSDASALQQWQGGNLIVFVMCEGVALLGLVLRYLGAELLVAAPFYAASLALLLVWTPRAEFTRQSQT